MEEGKSRYERPTEKERPEKQHKYRFFTTVPTILLFDLQQRVISLARILLISKELRRYSNYSKRLILIFH